MALTLARFAERPGHRRGEALLPAHRTLQRVVRARADVAMLTLGGELKKKESLSARLGDVLSYLYLASMVLKHHHDQGSPQEDLPLVEWACRSLLYRAQEQLHDLLRNFPNRPLAALMRALVFPRGRTYFAPGDRLGAAVAGLVMEPTPTRDRLCRGAWRSARADNPLALLQEALVMSGQAEPLERRLRVDGVRTGRIKALDFPTQVDEARQLGILNEAESKLLLDYDRRIMQLINVDDFGPGELAAGAGGAS
jgi:acyl-CoA dehydrogenase